MGTTAACLPNSFQRELCLFVLQCSEPSAGTLRTPFPQGGWVSTPVDHPGLFMATAETAQPGPLLQALQTALQVGGACCCCCCCC